MLHMNQVPSFSVTRCVLSWSCHVKQLQQWLTIYTGYGNIENPITKIAIF